MSFPVETFDDSSLSSDLPLPNEISMNCFAFVPRRYHPSLSLVSKSFGDSISSPEFYLVRSLLNSTEDVLYVALRLHVDQTPCWFSLNPKPFKNESALIPIQSFPSLPHWGSSVVAIGYEIYVFGGCIDGELTTNVFVVDCRFHTRQFLSSMRVARGCAATVVIDGKVYVIGGCKAQPVDWIEMFDLKTKTWESVIGPCNEQLNEKTIKSFVMHEKIYVMDNRNSYVYDPKEKRWEMEIELNKRWRVGSCVIDNMLYTFRGTNKINVYDPIAKMWRRLKGVEGLPESQSWYRMVNYGGKLAVLITGGEWRTEISCTEIELERRQGGEIWGKILSSNQVLSIDNFSSTIAQCLTVTI